MFVYKLIAVLTFQINIYSKYITTFGKCLCDLST